MRFLHFIIIYFFSINYCFSEQLFTPYIKDSSMDQRSIALVDTITGKNRLVEINTDGKIIWSWNFPSEINKSPRNICKGADIKYIAKRIYFSQYDILAHFYRNSKPTWAIIVLWHICCQKVSLEQIFMFF